MISVFICSPYGDHNSAAVRLKNTQASMQIWTRLSDAGFLPFCPLLSHFMHELNPRPRLHWLGVQLNWLEKCDCVLVCGAETEGMRVEITRARILNKPVFRNMEELSIVYGVEIHHES